MPKWSFLVLLTALAFVCGCASSYEVALQETRRGRRLEAQGDVSGAIREYCEAWQECARTAPEDLYARLLRAVIYHRLHRLEAVERFEKGELPFEKAAMRRIAAAAQQRDLLQRAFVEAIVVDMELKRRDAPEVEKWLEVEKELILGDQVYREALRSRELVQQEVRELVPAAFAAAALRLALYRVATQFYLESWKYFPHKSAVDLEGIPQKRLRDVFAASAAACATLATFENVQEEFARQLQKSSSRYRSWAQEVERHRIMSQFKQSPRKALLELQPESQWKRGRNALVAAMEALDADPSAALESLLEALSHFALAELLGLPPLGEGETELARALGDALIHFHRLATTPVAPGD